MKYTILDIETSGQAGLEAPALEPSKVLKDPEKIKADIASKQATWLDEAALHAERGFVVCAGMMDQDENLTILEGEEPDILRAIWKVYSEGVGLLIGHNIKGFDLPFLIRRSWMNKIVPSQVLRGRYFNDRIIDTMETWACGNYRDTISLSNLAKAFGLEGKTGSGKDFAKNYFLGGASKQSALEYLKTDLLLTHRVSRAMGIIQ